MKIKTTDMSSYETLIENYPLQQLIFEQIKSKNPRHAKKLAASLGKLEAVYYQRAESFYQSYRNFAISKGKDISYGVESYLRMVSDYMYEQIQFMHTGEYSCKSFMDAYERVYDNAEVMEYYMHGLMMSQFLWHHHYFMFKFFTQQLHQYKSGVERYLEIGGGHGFHLIEAINIIGEEKTYDLVDISKSSIEIAETFIPNKNVRFILQDIYKFEVETPYDFICMGEVLEHVEDPVALMKQLYRLLSDDGTAFITVPANAPAIDHIYLFTDPEHIRNTLSIAGFEVVEEAFYYSEDVSPKKAKRLKIPLLYGAFIKKIQHG